MTHADYLNVATPAEFRAPAANLGGLISSLFSKLENAMDARERRKIRERIDRELAELAKRRGGR